MASPNVERIKAAIEASEGLTVEEAHLVKLIVNSYTLAASPNDERIFIEGVEAVQSVDYPAQKVFLHPFTLGTILNSTKFNSVIDIIKSNEVDADKYLTPLPPAQQQTLDLVARMDREELARS